MGTPRPSAVRADYVIQTFVPRTYTLSVVRSRFFRGRANLFAGKRGNVDQFIGGKDSDAERKALTGIDGKRITYRELIENPQGIDSLDP